MIVVGAVATWSATMVEKYLTQGLERLGDDIRVVDVNPAFELYATFAVPPDADLSPPEGQLALDAEEIMARGGVYLSETVIQITLETSRSKPVTVTRIAPVLVGSGCSEPLGEGWGFVDNGGQGGIDGLVFMTTIDAPSPVLNRTGFDNSEPVDQPDYFGNGSMIELVDGETTVLQIMVEAGSGFCHFAFRVEYIGSNGPGVLTIDDDSKPFKVSAVTGMTPAIVPTNNFDWFMPHATDGCLTSDGQRAKLTEEQVANRARLEGREWQEYCAKVGVA
ncbi:hypothetical protein HGA13_04115 [Nocardia speluncae]|uniref:Uncharacterized protein n=1 Tax=Nocardia speluncae TaxID=419477 RepID=A0A846XAZ1_9NOCA|nr:hypothetical protein [Nocardia speluncae]NKY32259.1 hypothetical protein [Nocardia speluncae]